MAAQSPKVDGEDMFDGLVDSPISEERPALKIRHIQFYLSARLEDTKRDQNTRIPAFVEDDAV